MFFYLLYLIEPVRKRFLKIFRTGSGFLPKKTLNQARLEVLELLSGLLLCVFAGIHMLLVSTILLSPSLFDLLSAFMERFYIIHLVMVFVFLILIIHFVLVFRKVSLDMEEQIILLRHSLSIRHRDSILFSVQVFSGGALLFLIPVHMWNVFVEAPIRSEKLFTKLLSLKWMLLDSFLFVFVGIHAGLGIYRIGIKWGFLKRRNRALAIIGILVLVYFFVEFLNLCRFRAWL